MKYKGQEFVCKNEFDERALYNNNKNKKNVNDYKERKDSALMSTDKNKRFSIL